MVRVLIVEDSAVQREYLISILAQDPALEVIGTAVDGIEAVDRAVQLRPDLIVMDVHMPRLDGYEATRRIMERAPTPIVIVSASSQSNEVELTFEALRAGALIALEKPAGLDHQRQFETARHLVETIKTMAEVKVVRRWPDRERPTRWDRPPASQIALIAVAASTGGPQTLGVILARLPRTLSTPILIVQHIAPGFVEGLAGWLSEVSPLMVRVAEDGTPASPGTVYLAPNGSQMGIGRDRRIRITNDGSEEGFRPSASYLFRSVAESFGPSAMGVLLSGMGKDGAAGLAQLRAAGGVTIAQTEESSVVFGMAAEAIRLGAAEHILAPQQISELIRCAAAASRVERASPNGVDKPENGA